jgi:hypothetical protein
MNKFILSFVAPLICLVGLFNKSLWAQPGKSNDVVVIGDFTPKLADAEKIQETPLVDDSSSTQFKIDYELQSRKVPTAFEIDPIKAAKVKGEPLNKIYQGYVKGGFGSYMTPFGELYYGSERNKYYMSGLRLRHFSSSGQIANVGYSGFSNNEINLFGKSIRKKVVFGGNLDYRRDVPGCHARHWAQ